MSAEIIQFPSKIYRFTYTVIMKNNVRINGQADRDYSSDLVEELLDQYPDAVRISVIKEKL